MTSVLNIRHPASKSARKM